VVLTTNPSSTAATSFPTALPGSRTPNTFQRGTGLVEIDFEDLDRLIATVVHHIQFGPTVGRQAHVDAVRPKFQRIEIGLLDESFGV